MLEDRLHGIRFTDAEQVLLARNAKAVGREALMDLDTTRSFLKRSGRVAERGCSRWAL
jgi:hypothetical protein